MYRYYQDMRNSCRLVIVLILILGQAALPAHADEVRLLEQMSTHYPLAESSELGCTTPVRIMPLGDSITRGAVSGVPDSEPEKHVGYRKDLWHLLDQAGYKVDFVGSLTHGEYYQPLEGFDPHHEGHRGWRDDQIATRIYGWLVANPADIILLHIGTNGLHPSPQDVENILNEIKRYDESIPVILARIINRQPYSQTTTDFNNNVVAMAQNRIANGDKIIIVDMENGAGINYSQHPSGDMWDSVHPYATGYAKMANVWFHALRSILPACDPIPPHVISPPVNQATAGRPYTYRVEAAGRPTPTFALVDPTPDGMSINSLNGVISWVPTTPGHFDVTVEASNKEGAASQSFTITVSESPDSPVCPAGTVAYWPLNEPQSNTIFRDIVGGHDGSCEGTSCPAASIGQIGSARSFDGSDKVNVPDAPEFAWDNSDSFSIEMWVNSSQNCTENKVFMGKQRSGGSSGSWWVGCGTGGSAIFSLRSSTGAAENVNSVTPINNGAWNHLVAVRNAATNQSLLYVNGILEAAATSSYTGSFANTSSLNIGHYANGYFFNGRLDELAIYNRALTAQEVEHHYTNSRIGYTYCEAASFTEPAITSVPVTGATIGQSYSYQVEATGYPAPSFALVESVPDGMSIDAISGLITWTPAAPGHVEVSVQASNSAGSANQNFTIDVTEVPAITSTPVTAATVGEAYLYTVEATGYPAPSFALVESVPDGMSIDAISGLITWTPAAPGHVEVSVQASNSAGSANQNFTIDVNKRAVEAPSFTLYLALIVSHND
jgi:lysophospholipase L1-like esterase